MVLLRRELETYKRKPLLYSSMPKENDLMPSTLTSGHMQSDTLLYSSMPKENDLMPSTLTSGHMQSDVPMRPETLAPPEQVNITIKQILPI
jgi:hypothetical protein